MIELDETQLLVARIKPLLAGHAPEVQGAVLADLLATWIAGHIDAQSQGRTKQLRSQMLNLHVGIVRALIPENAKEMGLPW